VHSRVRILAVGAFVISLAASSWATPATFFGEDLGAGSGGARPNSNAARAQFLSQLSATVGTEDFEGFATGASTPLAVDFGYATATLQGGSGEIRSGSSVGRFPISGVKYWNDSSSSLYISFNTPQAAFGFYGTDIGDFDGQITLTLHYLSGGSETITVPNTINAPDSSCLYFGLVAGASEQFTRIDFGNTAAGSDYFGFDDFTIGTIQQAHTLWSDSSDYGGGLKWSPWFGWYYDGYAPWYWHYDGLGWVHISGGTPDNITMWLSTMQQWVFTRTDWFPFLYRYSDSAYLWYYMNTSNPQWFHNYSTGQDESYGSGAGTSIDGSLADTDPDSHGRSGKADYYVLTGSGSTTIDLVSEDFDCYLFLYNQSKQQVASNDDGAGNLDSRITYTLQSGQTYYVEATSYGSGERGAYTLSTTAGELIKSWDPWDAAVEVWDLLVVADSGSDNPSNAEWDTMRERIQRAANFLYDATDGQVRLGNVQLRNHNIIDRALADVALSKTEGSYVSSTWWTLGFDKEIKLQYTSAWLGSYATLVHELGHYKFRLGDEYTVYRFHNSQWENAGDDPSLRRWCGPGAQGRCHSIMQTQYHEDGFFLNGGISSDVHGTSEFCTPTGDNAHTPVDSAGATADTDQDEDNNGESCWATIHRLNAAMQIPSGAPLAGPCSKSTDVNAEASHEPLDADDGVAVLVNFDGP
jgi:hypothetical protein